MTQNTLDPWGSINRTTWSKCHSQFREQHKNVSTIHRQTYGFNEHAVSQPISSPTVVTQIESDLAGYSVCVLCLGLQFSTLLNHSGGVYKTNNHSQCKYLLIYVFTGQYKWPMKRYRSFCVIFGSEKHLAYSQ